MVHLDFRQSDYFHLRLLHGQNPHLLNLHDFARLGQFLEQVLAHQLHLQCTRRLDYGHGREIQRSWQVRFR